VDGAARLAGIVRVFVIGRETTFTAQIGGNRTFTVAVASFAAGVASQTKTLVQVGSFTAGSEINAG